jgi:hypothetical protein
MTADQIARAVSCSLRWVTGVAAQLPGARFAKNRHVFLKSNELAAWIQAQRTISSLDQILWKSTGSRHFPIPAAFRAVMRWRREILQSFSFHPFAEWYKNSREDFDREFDRFVGAIKQAMQ